LYNTNFQHNFNAGASETYLKIFSVDSFCTRW